MPRARSATVLVVDDVEDVRVTLRRHLNANGHTVIEASDGVEALKLVRRREGLVDLVLSDVVMPGMNGTQLADRVTAEFPGLPVILMSAFAPAGLARVGFRQAVIPVLQKPFDPGQLEELLQVALQNRRSAEPAAAAKSSPAAKPGGDHW